jgi:hypothetical protein
LLLGCTALLVILGGFIEVPALKTMSDEVTAWVPLITPFAMVIGVAGLVRRTVRSIARSQSLYDRLADGFILVSVAGVSILGFSRGMNHPNYVWFFNNVIAVFEAGAVGIISLFSASAARRVLRLKNAESCFFVAALVLTFLTVTNLGEVVWRGYPRLAGFFDNVVSMAAMRGITITAAVGLMSTGLRVMLGIERSYLD